MTYAVYPGTTHKRFEHSLGVMDLTRRVFDSVTSRTGLRDSGSAIELIPELRDLDDDSRGTWRSTLVAAGMLHDVGHLPFSHAAEAILPDGIDHEHLTVDIIRGEEIGSALTRTKPYLNADEIAKLCIKADSWADRGFGKEADNWAAILSEIVTGDNLGTDRMDYLLRDSHHAGVAYGAFDVHRLIDGIRILAYECSTEDGYLETEPRIGITEDSLQVAEQFQMARYLMFTQVYNHKTRVSLDLHLVDFMKTMLSSTDLNSISQSFLSMTDDEVLVEMRMAAADPDHPGHEPARRLLMRQHFRLLHSVSDEELSRRPDAGEAIADAVGREFGQDKVKRKRYGKSKETEMPVLRSNGIVEPVTNLSEVFKSIPTPKYDYVFVDPDLRDKAVRWLRSNLELILDQ